MNAITRLRAGFATVVVLGPVRAIVGGISWLLRVVWRSLAVAAGLPVRARLLEPDMSPGGLRKWVILCGCATILGFLRRGMMVKMAIFQFYHTHWV